MFENNIVKASDYLNYFGVNLKYEVPNGDDNNNSVERYIWRIENYCNNILKRFYKVQEVNENNIQHYKVGVMLMIYHSLRVGFTNLDGITGEAYQEFKMGGFCNAIRGCGRRDG